MAKRAVSTEHFDTGFGKVIENTDLFLFGSSRQSSVNQMVYGNFVAIDAMYRHDYLIRKTTRVLNTLDCQQVYQRASRLLSPK